MKKLQAIYQKKIDAWKFRDTRPHPLNDVEKDNPLYLSQFLFDEYYNEYGVHVDELNERSEIEHYYHND